MYKQGIAFFCVTVSVVLASDVLIYKFAPEYVSAVQSMMSTYASSGVKSVDTSSIFNASDMQNVVKIVYIALGIIILLRIVQAVFADYFYKGTVTTIIKNVKKQLDDGASFMASPFMMSADMQPIDQNKMRQLYLARKGGVSLLGPIMAYLVLSLIFTFV
jgi:hypothetical protein